MGEFELQALCELGQEALIKTDYLESSNILAKAEREAWDSKAFDTLARLYLPLQEARRQIRQRCGEGAVRMHLVDISATQIVDEIAHGQLLVAGQASIQPALEVRQLANESKLYLETFLAAAYPVQDSEPMVVIVPDASCILPDPTVRSDVELNKLLPFGCLMLSQTELPADAAAGTSQTFAQVMALWERLHTPFLNAALQKVDPIEKMQAYRDTLRVDPACELAHQFLADIARMLSRQRTM